jgi:hypothetical protein
MLDFWQHYIGLRKERIFPLPPAVTSTDSDVDLVEQYVSNPFFSKSVVVLQLI